MQHKENLELLTPKSTDFMDDNPCSYMPGKTVRMNYKHIDMVSRTFATAATNRGWRRFGKNFVYPVCFGCNACKSLRIKVKDYRYSKSQRKTINRNEHTVIKIQNPTITQDKLNLYNKYHAYKSKLDGWKHHSCSLQEYFDNFVDGAHDFGKELLYYIDNKLVCVDLVDILDNGVSSVYCYYDPKYLKYSLGTYSLLYEIKLAQNLGLDWVYLGYWVEGCSSFTYKENFQPMEILEGFPRVTEKPQWKKWRPKLKYHHSPRKN